MFKNIHWSSENKLIATGFSFALCLTGLTSLISYHNVTELIKSAARVERTHKVFSNLTEITSILADAESGRRGYLLFKDLTELQRYQVAAKNINPTVDRLKQWSNTPIQQQQLTQLRYLIAQKFYLSEQFIALNRQNPNLKIEQSRLLTENQKNRLQIQQLITEMRLDRERSLQYLVERSQLNSSYRIPIEVLSTFLSFAILFGMFALVYRQTLKRDRAEARQETLAQARELSELKLRFFSMVSHEFRTPLSIILGSAQLLSDEDRQWTHEQKFINLERIQSSARSMNQLLTDILTLTRAEAGKLEFNANLMDVESFCINLIEDIKLCNEPNRVIKFTSHSYCPHARLDERLLYSILSNLLINALKYSPQGDTVEFLLKCEPNVNIFQIKDRGIGIPLEVQASLYEPFFRAHNVENIVGTGLGLAVVKKCVDLHQGEICVESKVDEGTTFTVKIPQILSTQTTK
ncbi:ATP-binding protein [Chamaesiphon minutus]|uniref:histidine kinase n=1 Tax=Chamaesiphon minutus (strain ATCC 27169 / PCC 6605) TaxID=1173020 RepID=K9UBA3_CHAP6|nr:ATP-binding protein [Chamaesiphon minutus]AFY92120.1 signal transduction histidine kinase [Chamaesiphon minutus PCC 6605]